MAKGTIVKSKVVKRQAGYLYYIDAAGNVRKTKMSRGAKKGHKTCTTPKKKATTKKRKTTTAKKKIRKHPGINQTTGRLKKGYKYGKNGSVIKAKKK